MDEPNIYDSRSDRRVIEESDKQVGEQTKEIDAENARRDRRRRRDDRRADRRGDRSRCRCGRRTRSRRRILSQNPFIIFYLEMYFKTPDKHVTEVARQAGKEWCALPEEERMKYIRLAERERKRRQRGTKRRHRRGCQSRNERR